jgi:hypothetical protein
LPFLDNMKSMSSRAACEWRSPSRPHGRRR